MSDYLAGGVPWLYPDAGDEQPPQNTKILLLTVGGIAITGSWFQGCIAWQRLPSRDKRKDNIVSALKSKI